MKAILAPAISLEVNVNQTFSTPIQICFNYTLPSGTVRSLYFIFLILQTVEDLSDACLMTLDSFGDWVCHSDVTISGSSICGSLSHFSEWSFGILDQHKDCDCRPPLTNWVLIVIIVGGAVVVAGVVTVTIVLIRKRRTRKEEYEMY